MSLLVTGINHIVYFSNYCFDANSEGGKILKLRNDKCGVLKELEE